MNLPEPTPPKGSVVLPCNTEQFGKFIGDLLKSPKKISLFRRIIIDINREDIENIYHMICQRLHEQHASVPISFSVRFYYADRSAVSISSIEELREYGDVKKSLCTSIRLEWQFLVDMPQASRPQKQRILIRIRVPGETERYTFIGIDDADYLFGDPFFAMTDSKGEVMVEIEHSHRTLGFDLENLIKEQIDALEIKDGFSSFFKKYGRVMFISITSLSFCAGIYFFMRLISVFAFSHSVGADSATTILQFFDSGILLSVVALSTFVVFISLVLIFFLSSRLTASFSRARPSFIRLSSYHERLAEEKLQKYNRRPQRLVITLAEVVFGGLFTSVIFEAIKIWLSWPR